MEKNEPRQINLNKGSINEPVRVCYIVDKKTKDRLAELVRNNVVLTASMMVDLAVNLLIDDLETGKSQLIIGLNK